MRLTLNTSTKGLAVSKSAGVILNMSTNQTKAKSNFTHVAKSIITVNQEFADYLGKKTTILNLVKTLLTNS